MKTLSFSLATKRKDLKQLFYLVAIIVGVIALGVAGYLIVTGWQSLSEILPKLPAGMFVFVEKGDEEATEDKKDVFDNWEERVEKKEGKYLEKAEKGEGMTHLARRSLGKYLQANLQNFKMTAEHKIYVEDYIAKKIGSGWLELGQEVEISVELIEEAIERSAQLFPEQLDNLTQYSQLVSF